MQPIKVLLVEDDKDWRRGLAAYLARQPGITVVGQAETGVEALHLVNSSEVDVVLMDIMLADHPEGIRLTAEIALSCTAKVIMLSSLEEKRIILDAFQAGAVDYLLKSDYAAIPDAVRAAARNRSPINAGVADQLLDEFRRLKQLEQTYQAQVMKNLLTPAEVQILALIEAGLTQTDIANRLVVSIHTVKVHVNHILKKLEETSSKDAAKKAKDMGII